MALNEKILERVRKVLTKTQNNPSAEEAETAMLIAQRIMVQYNLSLQDVMLTDTESVIKEAMEAMEVSITNKKRTLWWEKSLTAVIAENFRCKSFIRHSLAYGSRRLYLIGLKEDVELAHETIDYALRVVAHYSSKYAKENKSSCYSSTQVKNSWISGFIKGLDAKFKEQVKQNGWGLVLVQDPVVLDAIEKLGLKKGKRSSILGGVKSAFDSGYKHGNSFKNVSGSIK